MNPDQPESTPEGSEPLWVDWTLRFLPVPIGAFAASVTLVAVSIFLLMMGSDGRTPLALAFSGVFAVSSSLIAAASVYRHFFGRRNNPAVMAAYAHCEGSPTFIVVMLLAWSLSCMLTLGLHFLELFAANRIGGPKYLVTLGIAIALSVYMAIRGRKLLAQHFQGRGNLEISLTMSQAGLVVLFCLAIGIYGAWLMM